MQVIEEIIQNNDNMQTIFAHDIVNFNEPQVPREPIKYHINYDMEVNGNLTVKGTSTLTELAELQTQNAQLLSANKRLQERMEKIETRINMLWFAPGMPGYEMSKSHYKTIIE
jgi:hypothetical protein